MHLGHQVIVNGDFCLGVVLVNVVLEGREAQLVAVFKVSVVLGVLLNGVVGQVHESIVYVLEVNTKLGRRCAQISFLEEEQVVVLVEQHPNTNVELASVDQQRSLDVLLDDKCVVFHLISCKLFGRRRGLFCQLDTLLL